MFGDSVGNLVKMFLFIIPFSILGIWKLIEIIIWLLNNVSIQIG